MKLIGTGLTNQGNRFLVLESLAGGTLSQMLSKNRNRRFGQFWKKNKLLTSCDVLRCARSLAVALQYMHEQAIRNCVLLHRDLKPENICFAYDGTVKILDLGLARVLENVNSKSKAVYELSGDTGSLRYMAPEVAKRHPYNHKIDVYSFGIILWEMLSGKTPFQGLSDEEEFFKVVVEHGFRPPLDRKWPQQLRSLISDCWNSDIGKRPDFQEVIQRLDVLLPSVEEEKKKHPGDGKRKGTVRRIWHA